MDDQNQNPNQPWRYPCEPPQYPYPPQQYPCVPPVPQAFAAERREVIFAVVTLLCNAALWNCILYGGLNLGAAVMTIAVIVCSVGYLFLAGYRPDWYSGSLLGLSVLIAAGFARSNDGFVKFVMLLFLVTAVNLSLCLMARQNRRGPGGVTSLLDAPRGLFALGFGGMGRALRGLKDAAKSTGTMGKRTGAFLLGLAVAVPVVGLTVFLLMRADAAFEGLMDLLPQADPSEAVVTLIFGGFAALIAYSRGVALHRTEAPKPAARGTFRGWDKLTVNTILGAVCLVYAVYLMSQLAYFSGGFSGILPDGYTMAEYARRGFFEMAQLCAINLGVIWLAIGLVRKDPAAPSVTKLLCLFLGIVTIFLVITASAKMLLYIDGYGLTRLRVLTEVIMVFLGLTTLLVCVWLFCPKLPYMKLVMLLALVIGAVTIWADVDTQVAKYNVEAYQSGELAAVDVYYLAGLSEGAVPYLQELTRDADPTVAATAKEMLQCYDGERITDFREWNWVRAEAWEILQAHPDA